MKLRLPNRSALALVCVLLAAAFPASASACSCRRSLTEEAFEEAAVVAEAELVEVGPASDSDLGSQRLRFRLVRIFKGPPSLSDGDEASVLHMMCNSGSFDASDVGSRHIAFFNGSRGHLSQHFCSHSLSAWAPVPSLLLQSRQQWLRSRS